MGPRIYPSYQDTNINAKGTLIISLTTHINQIDIYKNGLFVDTEYKIKDGLCTIPININDVIRIESSQFFSIDLDRWDYTTDYENGDDGIKVTQVDYSVTQMSYTFTANTIFNSYNFEYRSLVAFPGPTPTPTPTGTPTPTPTITPTPTVTPTPTPSPTPIPGTNCGTQIYLSSFDPIIYDWDYPIILGTSTGTTSISADMQLQPDRIIVYFDNVVVNDSGYVGDASKYNYGQSFRPQFNIYLSGRTDPITNLTYPNTGTTNSAPDGFPYVSGTPVGSQTFYNSSFNKNTTTQNCFVKVLMPYAGSGLYFTIGCPGGATPLPTNTPTPTPTVTPTPTPTQVPLPTGSLFYYDPGNIASYPGSGSILYDLSGNGRHANINTGITWVSGSAAYFNLNGNDNNSITGTTLSQTLTSWSMWIGIYRNDTGSFLGYDGFMIERTGASNVNGLGTFGTGNRLDLNVNNGTEIVQTSPGTMTTGSWMFLAGAVDNTTYTMQVYSSGSLTFQSGSKAAGSSNFNDPIVMGEDKEAGVDRTMNGRIGPALMYDRKLTTTELTVINDYFKSRYGI